MDFQWDERNLRHVLVDSPRGVTPALVQEIADGAPKVYPNRPGVNRSGSHLMVGPSEEGQFWTIVLLELGDDTRRPITG